MPIKKREKENLMKGSIYDTTDANKYSKISLEGEGTLYLAFRDFGKLIHTYLQTAPLMQLKR